MALINNPKLIRNWISQDPIKPFFAGRTITPSKRNPNIVCKQHLEERFYTFLFKQGKKHYPNQTFKNLGELLCYELINSYYPNDSVLIGHKITLNRNNKTITYIPDLETPDHIIEIRELKWFGTGMAKEKIFAIPMKYFDLISHTGKSLKIICVAKQEHLLLNDSKLACFGNNVSNIMEEYMLMCERNHIQFYGLHQLLLRKQNNEPLFD